MSGNMHLTGDADMPMKNFSPYVDFSTAAFSALGTVAMMSRTATGAGQHVETSLLRSFGDHECNDHRTGAAEPKSHRNG
jgi:crotonobetainyl-CoA:carnitine CoA-transferase CaiB-like acyl-CoA transferase